jgi:hypothetical protein
MAESHTPVFTGGCQCGAVRFACYDQPQGIAICHCRMCQKAVGGPFASLVDMRLEDFAWTRGAPAAFRSSSLAERDFCAKCGTPLGYREIGGSLISLTTGSFDAPSRVVPTVEVGIESKLGWTVSIAHYPGKTTDQSSGAEKLDRIVSYQHPDHDTPSGWAAPTRET